jgi:rhamnose utilization protein RhaD (predicted bifunctional aldolase and dehydrogenase)
MNPLAQLVALSHRLGAVDQDLVVLAEGNTSVALSDGTFFVKASGARLAEVSENDFARLRLAPLVEALIDGAQADAGEVLTAARIEGATPSIETFAHAAAIGLGGAQWVAHTHPTALVALLCSSGGEEALLAGPLFPDEAVVCGAPLYLRYAEPGVELGRAVARLVSQHVRFPRTVLLGNHGLFALGASAAEAEAVTVMAAKAARVRVAALIAGGLRPLPASSAAELEKRADEVERRARLVGEAVVS